MNWSVRSKVSVQEQSKEKIKQKLNELNITVRSFVKAVKETAATQKSDHMHEIWQYKLKYYESQYECYEGRFAMYKEK